jgi:succinylglutamate desuccinylase
VEKSGKMGTVVKIKKIYVVAALHGDEPFGLKVLAHLRYLNDKRVIARVGHPEAIAKRKEYLEQNLNRCFGHDAPASKETQIAKFIVENIDYHKPDLIIDLHTCECRVGKSTIIPKVGKELVTVAKRLGMDYVFEGVPDLCHRSLLGQHPEKTIVIELGKGYRSDTLAEFIAKRIVGLLEDEPEPSSLGKIMVYSDSEYLMADKAKGQHLVNYQFNKKIGGYPYLVGQNTYTEYVGFIAKKEQQL